MPASTASLVSTLFVLVVRNVAPNAVLMSVTAFAVKVDIPGAAGLRPGQFGRLRFAGSTRQTLTVPTASIVRRGQLTFVFALDAESRARLRPVSIGEAAGARVEVLTGIKAGDLVVTNPPPSLTDGARVAVSRSAAPSTGEPR